jgi:hypothetical protein
LPSNPIVVSGSRQPENTKGSRQGHPLSRTLNGAEYSPLRFAIRNTGMLQLEAGDVQQGQHESKYGG